MKGGRVRRTDGQPRDAAQVDSSLSQGRVEDKVEDGSDDDDGERVEVSDQTGEGGGDHVSVHRSPELVVRMKDENVLVGNSVRNHRGGLVGLDTSETAVGKKVSTQVVSKELDSKEE
jgi:hypothetical protein